MFGRVFDLLIQYNFIVIFLVLVIVASLLSADFLTIQNVANLFQQATIVGVVAVGMTFVILIANIDLSVGSVVALGEMVVAVLLKAGVPPFLAGCLTVLTGPVLGFGMGPIHRLCKGPKLYNRPGRARQHSRRDVPHFAGNTAVGIPPGVQTP